MFWRYTTSGGVCRLLFADLSCHKRTYEDIVLSELHSRPEEIGSVSKHVCLWACVSAEAFKMPRHWFPLSLFRYHPTFSAAANSQTCGRNSTQAHAHARKHTHNLWPLAAAKTVSAAILSGHEMTSISAEWCGCAVAGARQPCRYTQLCEPTFLWPQVESIPLLNFNTWHRVIGGVKMKKANNRIEDGSFEIQ